MSDILDFYMELPAMMAHVDPRKPLCNKGAKKPKAPPPAMAPYEEVEGSADTTFSKSAQQRKGLRATILSSPRLNAPAEGNLGVPQMATLGQQPIPLGARAANMTAAVAAPPQKQTALGQTVAKMK